MLRKPISLRFEILTIVGALIIVFCAPLLSAQVFVLTVGPHGTYSSIQDAVNAVVSDSSGYIQVEQAQYYDPVVISASLSNIWLEISGGWDSTFTTQSTDPTLTRIEGGLQFRPFTISHSGGTVTLRYLTLTHGHATTWGGGISISPTEDGTVIIDSCKIEYSVCEMVGPRGGGLHAFLNGQDRLELHDCEFDHNTADATGGGTSKGGGIFVKALDQATIWIEGNLVSYNEGLAANQMFGGGMYVEADGSAQAIVEANRIFDNSGPLMTSTQVMGAEFLASGSAGIEIRGLDTRFNNLSSGSPPAGQVFQVDVMAAESGQIILGDTLVAQGDAGGIGIRAFDLSTIHSTNLTVADNSEDGIYRYRAPGAALSLYNSIAFANGTNIASVGSPADDGYNLVGIDPLFEDPGCGFYWLQGPSSPAVDAGTASPPAGLGTEDARGGTRVVGTAVDIGAYELEAMIFSDGFESCDTSAWSWAIPMGMRVPCP